MERSHVFITEVHYESVIRTLQKNEMVRLWSAQELVCFPRHVFNGHFAVANANKRQGSEWSQQFILYARLGNADVERAPKLEMLGRGSLGEIILNAEDEWRMRATDQSVYFYSLEVPEKR